MHPRTGRGDPDGAQAGPGNPSSFGSTPPPSPPRGGEQFHAWLSAADQAGTRTRWADAEWFVTSTKFLDRIANSLDLEVRTINDLDAGEA